MEEKQIDTEDTQIEEPKKSKWDLSKFLRGISDALKSETITPKQAKQLRFEFGIANSFFTSKRISKAQRRRKRKLQKAARAMTRRRGHKGQKMPKGRRYGS